MKYFIYAFSAILLYSCGATVAYDFDTEKDFSQYTTYNFYPSVSSGLNELDEKRIMATTDSLLQSKGMIKSESPQLYVNFYSSEFVSQSRNTIGVGVGSMGRNTSVGVSGGIPIGGKEVNQRLTVDLIDVKKDALVWQAVTEDRYKERASPEQKESYYKKVLAKVFEKYPPKVK